MLKPERPAFSCVTNGLRQLSRHNLWLRSPKIIKIGQPLLPLFRAELRKDSDPIDRRRGLKRLRPPRIVFQPVIIIASNDDLFIFVPLTQYRRHL
jgi:hypothetical protein